MAIVDPIAVRFSDEEVRPLCERIRALAAELTSTQTRWFGGINTLFPNDSSALEDGREAEGVSRLTGADINNFMTVAINMLAAVTPSHIEKPAVRPLEVN